MGKKYSAHVARCDAGSLLPVNGYRDNFLSIFHVPV